MSEEVKLHGTWPSVFSYRVIWALKLKGIGYDFVEEDLSNKSALLLHYNPIHKKIPVLVHAGKPICESMIIIEYIEEMWPHTPNLLPTDPYDRSISRFWVKFAEDKGPAVWRMFQIVEEHGLGDKKYFNGEKIGMVDIAFGSILYWLGVNEDVLGQTHLTATALAETIDNQHPGTALAMPSRLRFQTTFEGQEAPAFYSRTSAPPQKKQKMSLSQTYFIAASARTKLGKEACRSDHNLRLLVGHANLLDSLMLDLHDAEREQEAWFNQTVQKAAKAEHTSHIQWADSIREEEEDEDLDDAASDTSESDDEEDYSFAAPIRRIRTPPVSVTTQEVEDEFEDFENDEHHALVRTQSGQSQYSPPELVDDSDSDDESPPNSPPHPSFDFSEQQRQAIATTAFYDEKDVVMTTTEELDIVEADYLMPTPQAPLIAAC